MINHFLILFVIHRSWIYSNDFLSSLIASHYKDILQMEFKIIVVRRKLMQFHRDPAHLFRLTRLETRDVSI